jgi:hypothetical protein
LLDQRPKDFPKAIDKAGDGAVAIRKEPDGGRTNQAAPEPKLQSTVALRREAGMRSIKSTLLWLLGIPLPIILLIALFLHPG